MSYSKQNFKSGDTLYAAQLNAMDDGIVALESEIETTKSMVGSPLTSSTAAGMTDQTKIYVYTGSETGYTAGHWYYYDGTAWADGGIYNSVAVRTDTSLTVSGQAADSKAVGDAIDDVDAELSVAKKNLLQTQNLENITVLSGTYSGTGYVAVPVSMPAGSYDFTVDNITSSDTDATTNQVRFMYNSYNGVTLQLSRGDNIAGDFTIANDVSVIYFYASNSAPNSNGDTFAFTNFKTSFNYPLKKKIDQIEKIGKSDIAALYSGLDITQTELENFESETVAKIDKTDDDIKELYSQMMMKAANIDVEAAQTELDITKTRISDLEKDVSTKAEIHDISTLYANLDVLHEEMQDGFIGVHQENKIIGLVAEIDRLDVANTEQADTISGIQGALSNTQRDLSDKLPKPRADPDGTNGQVLSTNGDGTTTWVNQISPSDEQIGDAVSDWLEDHPEATTTVEDGSVTMAKLSPEVQESITDNSGTVDNSTAIGEMTLNQLMERRLSQDVRFHLDDFAKYSDKLLTYASCFTGNDGIGFLFFTDPHTMPSKTYNVTPTDALMQLMTIRHVFENSPAQYVLCGGDWITTDYTLAEAILIGGRVPNLLREEVSERAYTVIGNHDLNIEKTKDDSLTETQLARIWFDSDVGYYTIESRNCACVMFDSGYVTETMSDYRWSEVDWFAEYLLSNTKDHLFGVIHLVKHDNNTELGLNITAIADAFNQKTSITKNGKTYNFSESHGTFHFIMAGHHHTDWQKTINNIPIIGTTTSSNGLELDCCYADFNDDVLHLIRVGNGNSRDINIIPFNGYRVE